MLLIKDDHVVETLTSNGADHPFDKWILPRGVLPPLSVGEMALRLYGALNYSQNRAHDLRYTLNEV